MSNRKPSEETIDKFLENFKKECITRGTNKLKLTYRELATVTELSQGSVSRAVEVLESRGVLQVDRSGSRRYANKYMLTNDPVKGQNDTVNSDREARQESKSDELFGYQVMRNLITRMESLEMKYERLNREFNHLSLPKEHSKAKVAVTPDPAVQGHPVSVSSKNGESTFKESRLSNRATPSNLSHEERRAIEQRAIQIFVEHFAGWQIHDVSTSNLALKIVGEPHPGFDYIVEKGSERLHIEVKGTKQADPRILLTANELLLACDCNKPDVHLFVVQDIQTEEVNGEWFAFGGKGLLFSWNLEFATEVFPVLEDIKRCEAEYLLNWVGTWQIDITQTCLLEDIKGIS